MTSDIVTQTTDEKRAEPESRDEPKCAHHWIIEPPTGPTSKGYCKLCGAEKEFDNWGFESQ